MNVDECRICGRKIGHSTPLYSLQLRRDNPDYRWNTRLPFETRRWQPARHDPLNVVAICSDECLRRGAMRNSEGKSLSDAVTAIKMKADQARDRLKTGLARGGKPATCDQCGVAFPAMRSTAQYCGDACRAKSRRKRLAADD